MSNPRRQIEIFTAGCSVCKPQVEAILDATCSSCEVHIHDLSKGDEKTAKLADHYGVQRLPSVVIDGQLARCCKNGSLNLDVLRSQGLGVEYPSA